jgi:hypothetical protein
VVLHAHDEMVVEVDADRAPGMLRRLAEVVSAPPVWAGGFPIQVEAYGSFRYLKSPPPGAAAVAARNGVVYSEVNNRGDGGEPAS